MKLHPRVAQVVLRLQDQRFEHRYGIERRPPALRPVAIAETLDQPATEMFEIYRRFENFQRIAMLAERREMLRQAEKTSLIHDPVPWSTLRQSESQTFKGR